MAATKITKAKRPSVWSIVGLSIIILHFGYDLTSSEEPCGRIGRISSKIYSLLSAPGYRRLQAHYVSIIPIQSDDDPQIVVNDKCSQRRYVTKLLNSLKLQDPAVIVLDFSPDPDLVCSDAATERLADAIADAAKTTPVVLGEGTMLVSKLKDSQPQLASLLERAGAADEDLLLSQSGLIKPVPGSNARYGLTVTLCDNRGMPLNLYVWESVAVGDYKQVAHDSLSLAAAKAFRGVQAMSPTTINPSSPPLIALMKESAFAHVKASELVCADGGKVSIVKTWESCPAETRAVPNIRHRVVVIGLGKNNKSKDFIESIIGSNPGYLLQANYIEALLDDRVMLQASPTTQFILSIIMFVLIQLIIFYEDNPYKSLFAITCVALVTIFGSWLSALAFGRYFDFWVVALSAAFVSLLDKIPEYLGRKEATP